MMKWRDRKTRRLDEHGLREARVGLKRVSWFEMVDFIGSDKYITGQIVKAMMAEIKELARSDENNTTF